MARVTAVILAYGDEPWLERSVRAVLASTDVDADVVLVDNGSTDGGFDRLRGLAGVTPVEPGENLGFAGGCNAGAAAATGDVVALVNGDAIVDEKALSRLVSALDGPDVGIATGSIRLAEDPSRLNSGGNDIHFLGFSWSGRFNELAQGDAGIQEVTGASGAGMAMRRALWEELGGFDDEYFAYHEDTELSVRCWQRGLRVVYVPDAIVEHRYEFSRNPRKYFLLERNRLALLLTLFQRRTLLLLAPALVVMELATIGLAVAQRWLPQKFAGWRWLLANRRWVRDRRRQLQGERVRSDREVAHRFATRLAPGNFDLPGFVRPFDRILSGYWVVVRRLL